MASATDDLTAGARAMEQAHWADARAAYERVLEAGPKSEPEPGPDPVTTATALEGLGQALWFLGDVAGGVAAREAAFEAYAGAGRCDDAARTAVWVSHQHYLAGRTSAARGWLARAERTLETVPECAGHGWVAVERARHAADLGDQVAHCRHGLEVARRTGAVDLEVFALSLLGRAVSAAGRREEGMWLLEEAMAAATSGVVRNVHTLAEAYCNLVTACSHTGEWERAAEWCEHVESFARRHETAPLWAACRTVHAEVLIARGRWPEAEDALVSALESSARTIPSLGEPAVASLAELRVAQGRLAEAERLLSGRDESPSALRSLALLRTADGRPGVAVALLERGLASVGGDVVRAAQLLGALVDAHLAQQHTDAARAAVERLDRLAEDTEIRLVRARAALAGARVALAGTATDEATAVVRAGEALAQFSTLAMPLEVGESRLEIARALRATSPESAAEEATAALTTFRSLGAAPAVRRATAVLDGAARSSPVPQPRARHGLLGRPLTAREREVLDLVAQGSSNADIARVLVISEKTAGHHVSHILAKLGVRNRAEAVATTRPAAPS